MTVPTSSPKTLIVIRHSKAKPSAATDHARPLAPRGLRDARAAGEWLAARDLPSVVGLVSTAVRALQTWKPIAAAIDAETRALDSLYGAGVDEVLETLHLLDETDNHIAVVGHNPTLERVAWDLSDGTTDAHAAMTDRGFPTTAIAVLTHEGPWHDLAPATCPMANFHIARG
ncbi:MAG TPA: histidine phosphatase family protein [Nocardioidaceae bacterium]|nr:histidine phosphatase family protein [Nocardioidaceae bacterium]